MFTNRLRINASKKIAANMFHTCPENAILFQLLNFKYSNCLTSALTFLPGYLDTCPPLILHYIKRIVFFGKTQTQDGLIMLVIFGQPIN
jgi:hypothetical protein